MRNGVEHKEHDFCAQCGKHARHKRVNIHRCSPPLCVLSQRVIMAEKGGVDMMHLGSELRRIEQEAELEFRESMLKQLEDERQQREKSDVEERRFALKWNRINLAVAIFAALVGTAGLVLSLVSILS